MEVNLSQGAKISTFHGQNFEGHLRIKGDTLRLDIIQYKKGRLCFIQLTNSILEKNVSNYLIFSKVIDLFEQLIDNKQMEINDEGLLILPIEETFKGKLFKRKITIPLQNVKFANEQQERTKLYDEIGKVYNQKMRLLNILSNIKIPIPLNFTGDTTNPHYKSFEISKNGKNIKMNATNAWSNFNHCLTLPDFGIYYFKIKITKTEDNIIFIGICGKDIKSQAKCFCNPCFIGLYIKGNQVFSEKTKKIANNKQLSLVDRKETIYKLEINMNEKILRWYKDDYQWCEEKFNANLLHLQIYPIVMLYSNNDTIEFIG